MTTKTLTQDTEWRELLAWPALFVAGVWVWVSGLSPAAALLLGFAVRTVLGNPVQPLTQLLSKQGIQTAVVLLGFGMGFREVLATGGHYALPGLASILGILGVGYLLGRWLKVETVISTLVSGGTAICGGSAIAALSPVVGASAAQVAVAMSLIFLLNGVALVVFPWVGHALGLSQQVFGLWSALAIHDTSSVVGASSSYGAQALALAVPVKLTRALWIVPLCFAYARRNPDLGARKLPIPLFLFGFLLSAGLASLLPAQAKLWGGLAGLGHGVLALSLYLVGTNLSMTELRRCGWRPALQAVLLWVLAAGGVLTVLWLVS